MEQQITEATGETTFKVLERRTNSWGREEVVVEGPYSKGVYDLLDHHNGCEYGGMKFISRAEWADIIYCTGCNWSVYSPLGD